MQLFLDNRSDTATLHPERNDLEFSKRKFLAFSQSVPSRDFIGSNQLEYSARVDIRNLNNKSLLFAGGRLNTTQLIYEVDFDAEIKLSPLELAGEIKKRNGFLEVFPGVQSEDGETAFADFGEILVSLNDSTAANRAQFAVDHNLLLLDYDPIGTVGLYRALGSGIPEIFSQLRNDHRIRFAEPNYLGSDQDLTQNEPYDNVESKVEFENYWAHSLTGLSKCDNSNFGRGVSIAVLDSRVDPLHLDLRDAIEISVPELDFCPGKVNLYMESHGTQAASVALSRKAIGPNRYLGVAPSAKLLPMAVVLGSSDGYLSRIKALNMCGEIGRTKIYSNPQTGKKINIPRLVVNCSWQVSARIIPISFEEAFRNLAKTDVVITCSSGNDGRRGKPHYPSDYDNAVSVAAVKVGDIVACYSDVNEKVRICAPGGEIKGCDSAKPSPVNPRGGVITAVNGGGHEYSDGTSFASPYAAGMVAALWSMLPSYSSEKVRELFISSGTVDVISYNPDLKGLLKAGRVDAERISLAAQNLSV